MAKMRRWCRKREHNSNFNNEISLTSGKWKREHISNFNFMWIYVHSIPKLLLIVVYYRKINLFPIQIGFYTHYILDSAAAAEERSIGTRTVRQKSERTYADNPQIL